MLPLLPSLITAVLLGSEALGKTVTGLFKSETARRQHGQFITGFMYQGNDKNDNNDGDCKCAF